MSASASNPGRVVVASDHGGYPLKEAIKRHLQSKSVPILDAGTNSTEACDYPVFAYKVAKAVSIRKADVGILICKSGNGMAMVANKVPNVRAAICFDKDVAALSRLHNDANILVLGSEHLFDDPELIVKSWLKTNFEGGRHARRVKKIDQIEKKTFAEQCRTMKKGPKKR